ncbi:hypothetical protein FOZ61_008698, partial [Perkinsus olseni]
DGCVMQVGLLRAMLLATQELDEEEDVALLDEILQHGGVNIGIESPVHESGWWPITSESHEPENNENLSHFASDSRRNYSSAELLEESLMEYYNSEVTKGFMEDLPSLPPGDIVSRIAAIEKKNGGVRVIDDLRRSGVNARVCTEETIQLPGTSTTALILQRIRDVMTTGPEHSWGDPANRKYCVNCINTPSGSRLVAHKRLPFGLRSSPRPWCDNRAEGLQLYIDDRNYFCSRVHAARHLVGFLLLDAVLGIQDSYEKIRWDLCDNTVGIAKGKAEAIVSDIERILAAASEQSKVTSS